MAPKARPRQLVDILERPLRENETQEPDDIGPRLLSALYHLTDADRSFQAENGRKISAIHDFEACQNVWQDPQRCRAALELLAVDGNRKKRKTDFNKDDLDDAVFDEVCWKGDCAKNPRCLNWLGQATWEQSSRRAFSLFKKQYGLGDKPIHLEATPGVPIGLQNLGATCYMNSFLQVWFQNEHFRNAVFRCATNPDAQGIEKALFQLQIIFAALERGLASSFNPVALVETLKLNQGEQQDAQEFGKLFMDRLDQQFKKQASSDLKGTIESCFEGELAYVTQCRRCKWRSERQEKYSEISVPLKSNKSLGELLEVVIEKETLTGDNRYVCERCAKPRDVDRFTQIMTLPPVLHFSLMRFVFDFEEEDEDNQRKKSKAVIKIPLELNMGEYIRDADGEPSEPIWYDLKGMLLHKGDSAYSGHYVAHIHDSRYEQWFMFNDETVTQEDIVKPGPAPKKETASKGNERKVLNARSGLQKIDNAIFYSNSKEKDDRKSVYKPSHHVISDDSDGEAQSKRPKLSRTYGSKDKQRRHSFGSDSEQQRDIPAPPPAEVKSREAYMLVYTRREEGARPRSLSQGARGRSTSAMPQANGAQIPPAVEEALSVIAASQAAEASEYADKEVSCRAVFDSLHDQKRAIWNSWQPEPDQEAYLFDAAELEKWVLAEIDPGNKSWKKKSSSARVPEPLDDSSDSDCVVVGSSVARQPLPKSTSRSSKSKSVSIGRGDSDGDDGPKQEVTHRERDDSGFKESRSNKPISGTARGPAEATNGTIAQASPRAGSPPKMQIEIEVPSRRVSASPNKVVAAGASPVQQKRDLLDARTADPSRLSPGKTSIFSTVSSGFPVLVQVTGSPPRVPAVPAAKGVQAGAGRTLADSASLSGPDSMDVDVKEPIPQVGNAQPAQDVEMAPADSHPDEQQIAGKETVSTKPPELGKLKPLKQIDNSSLQCPHERVDIRKLGNMKAISRSAKEALEARGVDIKPIFSTALHLCRQCCWEPFAQHSYTKLHKTDIADFKAAAKGHGDARHISKAWLNAWLTVKPDFHDPASIDDPDPHCDEFRPDVFCEHGLLQPDDSVRTVITGKQVNVLQRIFDGYDPPSIEDAKCGLCSREYEQERALNDEEVAKARAEAKSFILKGLCNLGTEYIPARLADSEAYMVPAEWLEAWRAYLKQPRIKPHPGKINLTGFFCEHGMLLLDLSFHADRDKVRLIRKSEWEALVQIYGSKRKKAVTVEAMARDHLSPSPETCVECRQALRSQFQEIQIKLVFVLSSDLDKDGKPPSDTAKLERLAAKSQPVLAPGAPTLRRSTRANLGQKGGHDDASTVAKRRLPGDLLLKKADTLKDIRVMIEKRYNIPIMLQKIWFNGRDIEDSSETVESIGITEHETLHVLEVSRDDPVDFSDTRSKRKNKSKSNGRVEGFAGTGLHGFEADTQAAIALSLQPPGGESSTSASSRQSRERSDPSARPTHSAREVATQEARDREMAIGLSESSIWRCRECTFDNAAANTACELCDTPR